MDDVPELAPTTKGWLATFPATGLVSVAPVRLLSATASATAAASTAAWSTVIRDACDWPPVGVVEAPPLVPEPLRVVLLLAALVGVVAWLPVEVPVEPACPVELVCRVRWSAACAAPTFCCAASAAVSAAAQSLPAAAPAGPTGLLGDGDGEVEGEGEGDAVVPSPLGDAVGEGGDEPLPGAADGLDPQALVAASSAFCASASSELLPELVGPVLVGVAAVVRAAELVAGALLVLVLLDVADVADVEALSVSSVAFALSSDAVAATTASCSGAVSMVASCWPLVTVAPTCALTVVTMPLTGNETFVWSTFCTVPVTVSSCSTSPVVTTAVR
jgi:hypothetical protein